MDFALIVQTIAIYAIPVLFAITLHEAAHGYAAKRFGDNTAEMLGRITLNPIKHIDPVGTIAIPLVLYVATGRQISDLANGSVCLALTYNGDASMAADQARKANKPYEVAYRIPKEGTLVWQDNLAIPKDAPHPEAARQFIEFMLRPESVAALTNTLFFATANQAATPLVDEAVRTDPDIYPLAEVRERLYADRSMSLKDMRQRTRLWTTFRSRQ